MKPGSNYMKPGSDLYEAQIQLYEARIKLCEARIKLYEARIQLCEARIQLCEARIRLCEARIRLMKPGSNYIKPGFGLKTAQHFPLLTLKKKMSKKVKIFWCLNIDKQGFGKKNRIWFRDPNETKTRIRPDLDPHPWYFWSPLEMLL